MNSNTPAPPVSTSPTSMMTMMIHDRQIAQPDQPDIQERIALSSEFSSSEAISSSPSSVPKKWMNHPTNNNGLGNSDDDDDDVDGITKKSQKPSMGRRRGRTPGWEGRLIKLEDALEKDSLHLAKTRKGGGLKPTVRKTTTCFSSSAMEDESNHTPQQQRRSQEDQEGDDDHHSLADEERMLRDEEEDDYFIPL
jgi:hypothetical protein